MEKILIDKYGGAISFNTELNAITPIITNINCNLYKVTRDGQAITSDEVIDVKKDEFVLVCTLWEKDKRSVKAVSISDPATIYDLNEWYEKELNRQNNETI